MTDEILTAHEFTVDTDGGRMIECPHCHRVMGIESGPFRGEQYKDTVCGGWVEVDCDAKLVVVLKPELVEES